MTLLVSKFAEVPKDVIWLQLLKVWSIFTTLAVFNPDKSKLVNWLQSLNI